VASCLVHPGRSSGAHPDLHPFPTRRSSDLHQLTLALMKQGDAGGTLRAMAASLSEDFQGDLVRMVLFDEVGGVDDVDWLQVVARDRKSTRLNSSHVKISYAVFCLKRKSRPA